MNNIDQLAINSIRTLSVDMIQKAKSGHPGMPLGAAPIAYDIWANHMTFNPKDSQWINRDRFILSAGHASALLYSLLHLFEYDVSMDDLKQFRQYNSKTPGHPEYGYTEGVEATTGPLGAGLSTAVGMAMAQAHMAAKYNKENYEIFNHFTYVLASDGDMMEGITSEASSLAGTLGLGRLIVLYDSNNITIEGNTDLAFTENTRARYEAYGFETYLVEDGNDIDAIHAAIEQAKQNLDKPSFIEVRTKIGFGSLQEGTSQAHGAPLGQESIETLKNNLQYPSQEPFHIEQDVYNHFKKLNEKKLDKYNEWQKMFKDYKIQYPEMAKALEDDFKEIELDDLLSQQELFEFEKKSNSTRNLSGIMINRLKDKYQNLIGGSADLAGSNMTTMHEEKSFAKDVYEGRNLHFGVREHAMAAIGNGLVLYGGLKAYVATFFVFSDFLKPMMRLSALMNLPLIYVLTHDSIGVGEDGPTHEPIEQLSMIRSIPNSYSFRPADGKETAYAWAYALSSKDAPVSLILTRQGLPYLEETGEGTLKGGYVIYDHEDFDAIVMASGSELNLALTAAKELNEEGIRVRVVSIPSMELFLQQEQSYIESVLPSDKRKRLAVEAAGPMPWYQFVGLDGDVLTMDGFGASGPGDVLFKEFGFTVENVKEKLKNIL